VPLASWRGQARETTARDVVASFCPASEHDGETLHISRDRAYRGKVAAGGSLSSWATNKRKQPRRSRERSAGRSNDNVVRESIAAYRSSQDDAEINRTNDKAKATLDQPLSVRLGRPCFFPRLRDPTSLVGLHQRCPLP
jgi:hypothetical protein